VLLSLNPLSPAQLSLTLVLFGFSGVAGGVLGGLSTDRFGPVRTMRVQLPLLASMMVLVPFTRGHAMGVHALGSGRLRHAGTATGDADRVPHQAALLLSLNGSMLYLGSAVGAIVGGSLIQALGFERLSWVGLPFALLALATLWFDTHRHPHGAPAV
jgi:predicted MFS family arabinose efflux permease